MLTLVPMLQIQRDIYHIPRGWNRFKRYLWEMTHGKDDMVLPLPGFNPMAKFHLPEVLDALIAVDAEKIAGEAIVETQERLDIDDMNFRVGFVLYDDVAGAWTARELCEANGLRTPLTEKLMRGWLTVGPWSSEPVTEPKVRQAVLAGLYLQLYILRHGPARTLGEMMHLDGMARVFAGITEPVLDGDELEYTREVIRPNRHLNAANDFPTVFACLYGDPAAKKAGYSPLGLSPRAGCALALVEAKEGEITPEEAFAGLRASLIG